MSTHDVFVAAAYGVSALGLAGLIAWVTVDGRLRRAELRALEQSGVRRRSDKAGKGSRSSSAAGS